MFCKNTIGKRIIIKGNIIDIGEKYFERKLDVVSSAAPLLKYEIVKKEFQ